MMTPRKKSIAKKIAAGLITASLSGAALTRMRINTGTQLAIRMDDYQSVLNTIEISNYSKGVLVKSANRLAAINPVTAVGAEIARISDPDVARQYADSLYRYADDIQAEFAINARNVVEKAQRQLVKACRRQDASFISDMLYGSCGEAQARAVKNFTNFKRKFVKKTRKETLSNIRNQVEFLALAPKVAAITNVDAEKIAARFIRQKRIENEGRGALYYEDMKAAGNYVAGAFNHYVNVILLIFAMASTLGLSLAVIFRPVILDSIMPKKSATKSSTVKITSVSPNKNSAAKKIQSAVRKSQFRKKLRTALKKKGPAKPSSPPKKSLEASGSGSRSANKNTAPKKPPSSPAPPRPPTAPKKPPSAPAPPRPPTAPKKPQPYRNNLFSQIKAGKTLRKTSPKKSPKKSPKSMMNPVLVSALSARRAALSPNSPN